MLPAGEQCSPAGLYWSTVEYAVLAIDLGGTNTRLARFDADSWTPAERRRFSTGLAGGRDAIIAQIIANARELIAAAATPVQAIGVAAPGPLDPSTGMLFDPPAMRGWEGTTPLRDLLQAALSIPVIVGNDANAAALGEHRYGAGRGVHNLVYFTVSTGIGGGVIVDDRLVLGAHGFAGELGHQVLEPDGPVCGCGGRGCLEALASGTAIARIARERLAAGESSSLARLDRITAEAVAEAARAGDPLAREVFGRAAAYLGIGIVNAIHSFDPALVIIGGGVSNAGGLLLGPIREAITSRAQRWFHDGVRVTTAILGDDAGLLGAAAAVRDLATRT